MSAFTQLWLIEAARCSGVARKRALRAAKSACVKALKCANEAAGAFRSEALRLQGTLAWLCDTRSSAIRHWKKSIEVAEQMKMPLDRARALLEMGDRTDDESLVEQARGIFESIGAKVDLAFSLHVLARLAAATGTDAERALRRYDEAVGALEAVKADHAFEFASRERAALLAAC